MLEVMNDTRYGRKTKKLRNYYLIILTEDL